MALQACSTTESGSGRVLSGTDIVAFGFEICTDGHAGPVADLVDATLSKRVGYSVAQVVGSSVQDVAAKKVAEELVVASAHCLMHTGAARPQPA